MYFFIRDGFRDKNRLPVCDIYDLLVKTVLLKKISIQAGNFTDNYKTMIIVWLM